jgi:hypothetical protein
MIDSVRRVLVITHNTFIEAIRQKVLSLLLLFSLVVIGSAFLFTGFTFDDQLKFVKDFGFGAMTVFGILIAILGAAQMFQSEIENRTLYTLLAKPVQRAEFVCGKFFGLIQVLAVALLLMGAVVGVVLAIEGHLLVAGALGPLNGQAPDEATLHDVAQIRHQVADPALLQVFALTAARVFLVAGIAVFIATFATSVIFTVAATLLIYLVGNLEHIARETWLGSGAATAPTKVLLAVLSLLIPDFSTFGIVDDIIAGNAVPWGHALQVIAYSLVYLTVIISVAQVIFTEREL